jgi:hypothetical protein
MKFTAMVLASTLALSSTCAFAHTVRHKSNVRIHTVHKDGARSVVSRPRYRNPADNDRGWFHPTPPLTQSFDDPEGKNSGLPLP